MTYLTRSIWVLSVVSLLTDISSEMLYPVMPIFLQSIGFSTLLIGVLEGFAEAVAGLSKGYFGRLSDSTARRLPFVQLGYLLSALSKPLMAAFTFPLWIFSARAIDRLGKGIRTGARDALLSDETTPQNKGKVFGFHRSMDTLGAAIGPIAALAFLAVYPGNYRWLFLLAFIPALAGGLLTFSLKEKNTPPKGALFAGWGSAFNYVKTAPAMYRKVLTGLLVFSIFNSSDVFILLKIKEAGNSDTYVIGCYILYNLAFALAALPLGHLADRIGLKATLTAGLLLFSLVYTGFAFNTHPSGFIALLVLYGIYAAATEGVAKAYLSNLVPRSQTASAIGTYAGLSSVMALLAGITAGVLWQFVSPGAVFIAGAAGSALAASILWLTRPTPAVQ